MFFQDNFKRKKIIPVVNFHNLESVLPVLNLLCKHQFCTIEITIRSSISMDALRIATTNFPDAIVGAGTLKHPDQVAEIIGAGAKFAFTPGTSSNILEQCKKFKFPVIPGISTPSDIILIESYGIEYVKLFPAEVLGGAEYINALSGPFPKIKFCPTGGVTQKNSAEYLKLDNCFAIGGGWLTPEEMIATNDWIGLDVYLAEQERCFCT